MSNNSNEFRDLKLNIVKNLLELNNKYYEAKENELVKNIKRSESNIDLINNMGILPFKIYVFAKNFFKRDRNYKISIGIYFMVILYIAYEILSAVKTYLEIFPAITSFLLFFGVMYLFKTLYVKYFVSTYQELIDSENENIKMCTFETKNVLKKKAIDEKNIQLMFVYSKSNLDPNTPAFDFSVQIEDLNKLQKLLTHKQYFDLLKSNDRMSQDKSLTYREMVDFIYLSGLN